MALSMRRDLALCRALSLGIRSQPGGEWRRASGAARSPDMHLAILLAMLRSGSAVAGVGAKETLVGGGHTAINVAYHPLESRRRSWYAYGSPRYSTGFWLMLSNTGSGTRGVQNLTLLPSDSSQYSASLRTHLRVGSLRLVKFIANIGRSAVHALTFRS